MGVPIDYRVFINITYTFLLEIKMSSKTFPKIIVYNII